ncbi:MAG: glycosyltransferase family 39 protein [Thermoleophilia bacterium]
MKPEAINTATTLRRGSITCEQSSRLSLAISLGAILAFVLAITLPFSNQALHIDDAIFWDFAKTNLESPFQQHINNYNLVGEETAQWRDTHPPLTQTYLAGVMYLTGSDSESPLHLAFIIFPMITGVSMFFLARRFTSNALLATMLLLGTPVIMTLSHTLMADVPMLAFWLVAAATYIYGVDRNDWRLLALAGVFSMLAVMTGYQALALCPLFLLYAWLNGRLNLKTALPAAAPLFALFALALVSFTIYGTLPRLSHVRGLSVAGTNVIKRAEGILVQLGGASVFPVFIIGFLCLRRRRYLALLPVMAFVIILGLSHFNDGFTLMSTILFIIFMGAGSFALFAISSEIVIQSMNALKKMPIDRDFLFLGSWVLMMAAAVIIMLPHTPAKYTLPILAPLVLILVRETESGVKSEKTARTIITTCLVLTLVVANAVSVADYQLARSYREFAFDLNQNYETSGTVWFIGEWGFRHYMESQGYRYLTSTNDQVAEGDLVVKPQFGGWPLAETVTSRMKLLDSTETDWSFPVRVMSPESNAGFYGSYWGMLPYSITDAPLERFAVYRIGPSADQ